MKRTNVHDAFFRNAFSHKRLAIDIFRKVFTPTQFSLFAWGTLKTSTNNFFDRRSKEKRTDLIFSVKLKESRKPANIVLLLEHKSYKDNHALQQVLEYQTAMYAAPGRNPIIPIIIRQGGPEDWSVPLRFRDTLNMTPTLRKHFAKNVLDFTCLYLDLQNLHRNDKNLTSYPILYIMAHARKMGRRVLQEFIECCRHIKNSQMRQMLLEKGYDYVHNINNKKYTWDWISKFESEILNEGDRIMPYMKLSLEKEREEGREEGREKGRKKAEKKAEKRAGKRAGKKAEKRAEKKMP